MKKVKVTVANNEVLHLERHWYDWWLFDTNKFMSFVRVDLICRDCGYPYIGTSEKEKIKAEDKDMAICKCPQPSNLEYVRRRIRLAVHWILKIEPEDNEQF